MEEVSQPLAVVILEKAFTPIISAIVALVVAKLISRNKKIKNSATMEDLEKVKVENKEYTDLELKKHLLYSHVSMQEDIKEVKQDTKEVGQKLDSIIFMMLGQEAPKIKTKLTQK